MNYKELIENCFHKFGLHVVRYPSADLKRRIQLIRHFKVNKILDVGANIGQYGEVMRDIGYDGEIISFEPLSEPFKCLEMKTKKDPRWRAVNMALGNFDGDVEINVAGNEACSSSMLEMSQLHLDNCPQSLYVGKEIIHINRLDTVFKEYHNDGDKLFLKIDTQGFEKNIIDGAELSLCNVVGIQLEMSLESLYKGEMLFEDMLSYVLSKGYRLYSLEDGFTDASTGRLLQVDGIFFKET